MPLNPVTRLLSHDRWSIAVLFVGLAFVGGFARHEISPLPWTAFSHALARHGMIEAIATLLMVVSVELWLLWIPGHSYILNHSELSRREILLIRWLNIVTGLLLLTPGNPIYKLISAFGGQGAPDDY